MSTYNIETFSYSPIQLAESMTTTVHSTLDYLYRHGNISKEDYETLTNTLAVYAMPNRKGFGRRLLERFFGTSKNDDQWVFPIVSIDAAYTHEKSKPNGKPDLNVVEGDFGKDK